MSYSTPRAEIWVGDPHADGYPIQICSCEDGPYIGTRQRGRVDVCERCWMMTLAQWDYLVVEVEKMTALRAAMMRAEG